MIKEMRTILILLLAGAGIRCTSVTGAKDSGCATYASHAAAKAAFKRYLDGGQRDGAYGVARCEMLAAREQYAKKGCAHLVIRLEDPRVRECRGILQGAYDWPPLLGRSGFTRSEVRQLWELLFGAQPVAADS